MIMKMNTNQERGHYLVNIIGITKYQYQELCELLAYVIQRNKAYFKNYKL